MIRCPRPWNIVPLSPVTAVGRGCAPCSLRSCVLGTEEGSALLLYHTVPSCCVGCNPFQQPLVSEKKQYRAHRRIGRLRHLQNRKWFSGGMSRPWVPRQLLGFEPAQDSFLWDTLKVPVGSAIPSVVCPSLRGQGPEAGAGTVGLFHRRLEACEVSYLCRRSGLYSRTL